MSRPSLTTPPWLAAIDARWPGTRQRARRRAGPIALTILLELLLLLALLSLGAGGEQDRPLGQIVTTFDAAKDAPATPEQPADDAAAAPQAQPAPTAPQLPSALPSPPPIALPREPTAPPIAPPAPPAEASPNPSPPKIRAVIRSDMAGNRGPPDTGTPGDSQRVAGSGPNGEPLYAARWYREPTDEDYRGYFSRVSQSGWALINCRTEPEFRVDGCVLVDQSDPAVGSAVMAMAWQFRVRPPRVGGRSMVGEWVRIRIDYLIRRE